MVLRVGFKGFKGQNGKQAKSPNKQRKNKRKLEEHAPGALKTPTLPTTPISSQAEATPSARKSADISKSKIEPARTKTNVREDNSMPTPVKQRNIVYENQKSTEEEDVKLELNEINALSKVSGGKALVKGKIFDIETNFLIDTGSQVNAIPKSLVPRDVLNNLGEADFTIQSFSGNELITLGTFSTDIWLNNLILQKCTFIVIDAPCRTVLGTPALTNYKITIDLSKNKIYNDKGSCEILQETPTEIDLNYAELKTVESDFSPILLQSEEDFIIDGLST